MLRCWSSPRPAAGPSPRNSPSNCPAARGWSSRPPATRASTAGSSRSTRSPGPVHEVSIGDYVLAGGEAAVLVITEAVARLLPGVLGNAESHRDDSFAPGAMADLLEGPVYTKPPLWRGARHPRGAAQRPPRPHRALAPRRGVPAHRGQPARPDRALRPVRLRQERPRRCSTILGWRQRPGRAIWAGGTRHGRIERCCTSAVRPCHRGNDAGQAGRHPSESHDDFR